MATPRYWLDILTSNPGTNECKRLTTLLAKGSNPAEQKWFSHQEVTVHKSISIPSGLAALFSAWPCPVIVSCVMLNPVASAAGKSFKLEDVKDAIRESVKTGRGAKVFLEG